MLLSILIPTLPIRKSMLDALLFELRTQISASGQPVEVLVDAKEGTVGAKRQRLLEAAQGEYVTFVDDDDEVTPAYMPRIIAGIETLPDVIGFCGYMSTNGKFAKNFSISKAHDYTEDATMYYRFNNHLCPVRREIALKIGYKDMRFAEDYDYALRLKDSGLIQTEYFIYEQLYHYKYVSKKVHR